MKKIISSLLLIFMISTLIGCTDSNNKEVISTGQVEDGTTNIETNKDNNNNEKVLVYLSGPEVMLNKLEEEFEKDNGDVLDLLIMSCGQVRSKVWTEKEAGNIQADIVWGADPIIFKKLNNAGLLQPLTIKNKDSIKERYINDKENYILVNERYISIIYNKDSLDKDNLPKSYEDLKNDKFNNALVLADANQSATALGIASALYQMSGNNMEFFKGIHNNGALLIKSNGQVPSKVMEGAFDIGIGPHDSVVRLKNKAKKEKYDMPLEIIWPEEGAFAIQRPLGIIKNDNRDESKSKVAMKFVNFLVSKKAQMITNKFGFASVRKDIENNFVPDGIEIHNIDWDKAVENEKIIKKEYQEIFKK